MTCAVWRVGPDAGWVQVSSGVVHLVFTFGMFSVFRSLAVVLHSYFPAPWPPPVRKEEVVRGLVLASGKGSRLRTPRGRVKPLVSVAGVALLERAVRNLVDVGVDEVVVVVGYRAEEIERFCAGLSVRLGVSMQCVGNDRFDEGNGLSVLAAEEALGAEPFLLVMADHLLDRSILWSLVGSELPLDGAVLAVDHSVGAARGVDLDDVTRVRTEGRLVHDIGKGISSFDAFDTGAFLCTHGVFDALRDAIAAGETSLSAGMHRLVDQGRLECCDVTGARWVDVDTRGDLRMASRWLLAGGGKERDGAVAKVNRVLSGRVITPLLLSVVPGLRPDTLTVLAAVVGLSAAAAILAGWVLVAALAVQLASILDGADGEIARVAHRGSRFGAFLDPMLDRVVDGLVFSAAGLYLATQVGGGVAAGMLGVLATVGHLLVSYSTSRAALDLGHRYEGRLVASGRGRDLRLLVLTAGLAGAAVAAWPLPVALGVVATLTWWIIAVRMVRSWRASRLEWADVDVVIVDFDGTIADSMGLLTQLAVKVIHEELGLDVDDARSRYLASTGADFATQLGEIDPSGGPARTRAAHRFEVSKPDLMDGVDPFPDLRAFLDELHAAGVEVCICSSTRRELVRQWTDRHRLGEHFRVVDAWSPGHDKAAQMHSVLDWSGRPPNHCLVVGDSRRDGRLAASIGMRFRGVLRPGTSNLEGSGFAYAPDLRSISTAVATRRRLGVVTLPHSPGVPHLGARQPHTAAPASAVLEQRDHDQVSTRIGDHADPTLPAAARRVNPELRDRAGQRHRIAPRMGSTDQ
jgi:choline kinase/phosphatidylglycerophosphate synthase/phosphoglycolate phosphatase-like HAD superfamily hydrolase